MPNGRAGLEEAIALAVERHRGQRDKSGAPYILHPLRVMFRLEREEDRIAAVLHDAVEDTPTTLDELRTMGFADEVVNAIGCLTKREGEDYDAFVSRVETSAIARRVKLADLEDNMDARRLPELSPRDAERLAKYLRVWHRLRKEVAR